MSMQVTKLSSSQALSALGICLSAFILSLNPAQTHAQTQTSSQQTKLSIEDARHFLRRTGFAPTEAESQALVGKTRQQVVDDMLASANLQAKTQPPAFVNEAIVPYRSLLTDEAKKAEREQQLRYGLALRAWWMQEMLQSTSPFSERMVLFWHNHFATSQQKVRYSQPMYRQQLIFRDQGLNNFRSLLHAVAKDPAMLFYLDGARNRKEAPNENFAREVMELFTLGEASAGGRYTESDIKEAARAFTGWSLEPESFSYRYRPAIHDAGEKQVLGRRGAFTGEQVLDIILDQPQVARFITGKLWREFVSPEPEAAEVQRIATVFREQRYDIKPLMRELLLSPAFWSEANRATLIKSPVELVVGTLRQFGFGFSDATPLVLRSASMGQNLFSPPNVKGWPGHTAWIDSTSLLDRKRFLEQLFRAIEMPDKNRVSMQAARMDMQDMKQSGRLKGVAKALGREGVLKVAQAQSNIWFDAEQWLATYGGHLDREPNVTAKLAIQKAVLPLEPINPLAINSSPLVGISLLRQLVLDPSYQLK